MTKLSTIEAEALRVVGRLSERRLQSLQESLFALCEAHWPEMRGPEPSGRLAKALWAVPPHLAYLFVHLYGVGDPRLATILAGVTPERALAALVLTEIEHGDAEGAREAYTALRLFEFPATRATHVRAAMSASAEQEPATWLRHAHRPALWRALVCFAIRSGRWDLKAMQAGLSVVAQGQANPGEQRDDPPLQAILEMLKALGVTFLNVGEDYLTYALRGEERPPVSFKQVADILAEGRQALGL